MAMNTSNITSKDSAMTTPWMTLEERRMQALQELSWSDLITAFSIVAVISSIGTILNGLAVVLTFFTELKKKNVNIFVCNIAITDLANCLTILLLQSYYMVHPIEAMTSEFCKWVGLIQFIIAFEEVTFVPYISVNRYLCLFHGTLYSKIYTTRNIKIIVCVSWLIAVLVCIPYRIGGLTGFDSDNLHCCVRYIKNSFWDTYYLSFTFVPIILANSTAFLASYKVYTKLNDHVSAVSSAHDVTAYKEIQRYTLLDIILPMFTLLPYYAVKYAYPDRTGVALRIVMVCFFMAGPVVRGLNILVVLRPYNRALLKLFGRNHSISTTATNSRQTSKNYSQNTVGSSKS